MNMGYPIEALDSESVAWFHFKENTWGNIRIENDYHINGVALKYADTAEFLLGGRSNGQHADRKH